MFRLSPVVWLRFLSYDQNWTAANKRKQSTASPKNWGIPSQQSCLPHYTFIYLQNARQCRFILLACINNERNATAFCALSVLYFLISFCVTAALALPWLGDIIIVITTSSSSCRLIILPGPTPPTLPAPLFCSPHHRGGEITFFTMLSCCLYCDSGQTPSHSPTFTSEYPTIGVMVPKNNIPQQTAVSYNL